MASLTLSDGRVVPMVKPHVGDQMELERQMKARNPKYGPKEFREDLGLTSFMNAFALFASLNRAGVKTSIHEVLEIDLEQLTELVNLEPGDNIEDEEGEGEQSPDPQPARTGDADE